MKELQFTLYEIFGYLLPGAVLCGGLGLLFWAIFFPQAAVDFDLKTPEVWVTFLVFAYIGGHVAQAIGNKIVRQFQSSEEKVITDPKAFPAVLVRACREKIERMCKGPEEPGLIVPGGSDPPAELPPVWLYRFCDDSVLRTSKIGEREVYIYREGFYRGTFIGFLVLTIAMIAFVLRLWCWVPSHTARIGAIDLTGWRVMYFAALSAISSRFLWNRYWRFAEYRVTQALLGFLTIKDKPEEKKPEEKKP